MKVAVSSGFYDFLDRPLTELDPSDADFVQAMRMWAKAFCMRQCPIRLVSPHFILSGQAGALVPFHRFMLTLTHSAARTIGLNRREEGRVTDDEALILGAVNAAKDCDLKRARLSLASLSRYDHLDALVHSATLIARI